MSTVASSKVHAVGDLKGWTEDVVKTSNGRAYLRLVDPHGKRFTSRESAKRFARGGVPSKPTSRKTTVPGGARSAARLISKTARLTRINRGISARNNGNVADASVSEDALINPQRSYIGPSVPVHGRVMAGDDLPLWTVERAEAMDGRTFILYRNPDGVAIGSRGAALTASGQIEVSRSDKQRVRLAEREEQARETLLDAPLNATDGLVKTLVNASGTSQYKWETGSFASLIHSTFNPQALKATFAQIHAERPPPMTARVVVIDLFCGMGGLSLGLRAAGFEHVLGIDECVACISTYRKNSCGSRSIEQRLRDGDMDSWVEALGAAGCGSNSVVELILVGSPPCQPYSRQGSMNGASDQRDGMHFTIELAKRVRPLLVVLENVPNMMHDRFAEHLHPCILSLVATGFKLRVTEHRCSKHGVPQKRQRVLVCLMRLVTDTEPNGFTEEASLIIPRGVPEDKLPVLSRDALSHIKNMWEGPRPVELQVDMPLLRARHRISTEKSTIGIVAANDIAPTLLTSSLRSSTYSRLIAAPVDVDPSKLRMRDMRMLTVSHGLLLQTFPEDMEVHGNNATRTRQIGNAVPPLLSRDLGMGIKDLLSHATSTLLDNPFGLASDPDEMRNSLTRALSMIKGFAYNKIRS